jgi:hypothetical protein
MGTSIILLVTWFTYGQPPSSYQTQFSSEQLCEAARQKITGEQVRLAAEEIARNEELKREMAGRGMVGPPAIPTVTTVCAAQ